MDAIEAIGGFIEIIGNALEFLSRLGEIGGKDKGIIKEQDDQPQGLGIKILGGTCATEFQCSTQ